MLRVKISLNEEVEVWEDFLSLHLGNSYIILGILLLEKLEAAVITLKTQVMKFQFYGEMVNWSLLKVTPLSRAKISLKDMM